MTHACQSKSCAESISSIVHNSDNTTWKVQMADILAEGDFLARDIVYHQTCKTTHWQRYVQGPQRSATPFKDCEDIVAFVAAEAEFYDELEDRIESGEYITTVQVENLYADMMQDHNIVGRTTYTKPTRRDLIKNVSEKLPNVVISEHKGNQSGILH